MSSKIFENAVLPLLIKTRPVPKLQTYGTFVALERRVIKIEHALAERRCSAPQRIEVPILFCD
jgi:hypothetical protein